jgi:hypothetical protein
MYTAAAATEFATETNHARLGSSIAWLACTRPVFHSIEWNPTSSWRVSVSACACFRISI